MPTARQFFSFTKVFSKYEKIIFFTFLCFALISSFAWLRVSYLKNTKIIPEAGGKIKEIMIGQPQSLNPLFASINDADRDISEIIFSGLLKYNEKGEIINDLAEKFETSSDGKTYEFTLKEGLSWSDDKKITSDDVIFTINTLQNPENQNLYLRLIWQDVKIEKIDERKIKFTLKEAYYPFIENFTIKILPMHIFEKVDFQELSSRPKEKIACSGPFKIKNIETNAEEKIEKVILERNLNYHERIPFLDEVEITFAKNQKEISEIKGGLTNFADISIENKKKFKEENFSIYSLYLPRYFALFLNQENKILKDKKVREALSLATEKEKIINDALLGDGRIVDGPFLEENKIEGEYEKYKFNIEEAKKKLDEAGWKEKNGKREKILKENEKATTLELNLFTVDQKELNNTAKIIKEKWQEIGVVLNINSIKGEDLAKNNIEERKYDILLYAQGLYMIPDPSSFWHSSQKNSPGPNLSLYQNEKIDDLLEDIAKELNNEKRKKLLQDFQKKLTEDIPAIFLYSPNYLYAVKTEIKGISEKYIIDPSKRFIGIENWYINEKRVKK